jgi:hypothetical protein
VIIDLDFLPVIGRPHEPGDLVKLDLIEPQRVQSSRPSHRLTFMLFEFPTERFYSGI